MAFPLAAGAGEAFGRVPAHGPLGQGEEAVFEGEGDSCAFLYSHSGEIVAGEGERVKNKYRLSHEKLKLFYIGERSPLIPS